MLDYFAAFDPKKSRRPKFIIPSNGSSSLDQIKSLSERVRELSEWILNQLPTKFQYFETESQVTMSVD